MPKQDKEGGINPPSTLARSVLQNSGRQSAAPLPLIFRPSRARNKRETRFVDTPVIIFKLIRFIFLSEYSYYFFIFLSEI